jgi:hypothetical protein
MGGRFQEGSEYGIPEEEYLPPDGIPREEYLPPEPDNHFPEPGHHFSEPDQHFSEPDQSFSEPNQHFSEPDQRFSEPDQRFSETDQQFSEPDQRFSEPDQQFSEPDQHFSFSEPDQQFSEPDHRFSEPEPPGQFQIDDEEEAKYPDFPYESAPDLPADNESSPSGNNLQEDPEDIFQFQEPRPSMTSQGQDYFNYSDPVEGEICALAVRKVIKILRCFSRVLSAMEPLAQQTGLVDGKVYKCFI